MSAYDYVFLRPIGSTELSAVVTDLNAALGTTFARQPSDYADYLSVGDGVALDLGGHDFDNDQDMAFEEFPYVITVRNIGGDAERRQHQARELFERLRGTGRYRLLLTADLQQRLGAFDPAGDSGK